MLKKKRVLGASLLLTAALSLSSHAEIIRYGQLELTESGSVPDIWISFAGTWQTNATTGILGDTLHLAGPGAFLTNGISGSGVTFTVNDITGTTDSRLGSNSAGSVLGIRGGANDDRIDPGEEVSFFFNQDLLVRYVASHDAAEIAVDVNGTSYDGAVAANQKVTVNQTLLAGELLTLGSVSNAWRVRAIMVETIAPPPPPPPQAVTVRYGQRGMSDAGQADPDIWISYTAQYQTATETNATSGALGDSLNLATGGEKITDTVSGSNLGLTLSGVSGGEEKLQTTAVGSVLTVRGGTAGSDPNKLIDDGESFRFSFNQDVRVKYIATMGDFAAYSISNSIGRIAIDGTSDVTFTENGSAQVVDLGNVVLAAGSNITFSTDTVGGGWALSSLVVETIPVADFNTWIADYGLTNSPDADPDYDYDGDGLDNLTEFGQGGDPTDGASLGYSPTVMAAEQGGTNIIEYVYARRTTLGNGLTYFLELSPDLVTTSWANSGYTTLPEAGIIDSEFEAVTNIVPVDLDEKFIRLRISN